MDTYVVLTRALENVVNVLAFAESNFLPVKYHSVRRYDAFIGSFKLFVVFLFQYVFAFDGNVTVFLL